MTYSEVPGSKRVIVDVMLGYRVRLIGAGSGGGRAAEPGNRPGRGPRDKAHVLWVSNCAGRKAYEA
jgi:hypothetical protein